jgi:hypothetical protein
VRKVQIGEREQRVSAGLAARFCHGERAHQSIPDVVWGRLGRLAGSGEAYPNFGA